jgi:hypothetical protein
MSIFLLLTILHLLEEYVFFLFTFYQGFLQFYHFKKYKLSLYGNYSVVFNYFIPADSSHEVSMALTGL